MRCRRPYKEGGFTLMQFETTEDPDLKINFFKCKIFLNFKCSQNVIGGFLRVPVN